MSGVNFDKDSAKRIARAVRKVESSSLGGGPNKRVRGKGGGEGGGTAATSPPPDIADTGETGTDTEYARADHTHGRGLWYEATDKASLPDVSAPALGYTSSDGKQWVRLDDTSPARWVEIMPDEIMGHVHHGSTSSAARPDGYSAVTWVGSVQPTNWQDEDVWIETV